MPNDMTAAECCATCEYWLEKYMKCDHPEQTVSEADDYMARPDKVCELYEPAAAQSHAEVKAGMIGQSYGCTFDE